VASQDLPQSFSPRLSIDAGKLFDRAEYRDCIGGHWDQNGGNSFRKSPCGFRRTYYSDDNEKVGQVKGKTILFWFGVIFTVVAPLVIGLYFKDKTTMWVAVVCGAFITLIARVEDIAELSLGPLRAKMRDTIREANATIEQLRNVSTTSAKAILTDLMAGGFMGSMSLRTRLDLHDQIVSALKEIGASETAIKNSKEMWSKGIGIIYHRAIRVALEGRDHPNQINTSATPEVREASEQLQSMVQFDVWQAPSPDEVEEFIRDKGLMTDDLSSWISDYRYFVETGEIKRRELFESQ